MRAGKVLGVAPTGDDEGRTLQPDRPLRLWHRLGRGTRAARPRSGLPPAAATAVHFALVSGAAMVMLPGLKVAPPVGEWGAGEIAVESLHHLVYALATGAA